MGLYCPATSTRTCSSGAGITHTSERITALGQALASAQSTYRPALNLVAARREETTRLEQAVVRALDAAELSARAEQ
jgi:hypothetical protein